MQRDYVNETCRNLEFDYMVLKYIQEYQDRFKELKPKTKPKDTFRNGIIFQYVLVFKTVCTLPDNSMDTANIRDRYHKFFMQACNQPTCARALHALDKIGLVKFTNNPFVKSDERQLAIKLTKEGKRMQYLLTGSTKAYPQFETAVTQFRHHAHANNKSA